MARRNRKRKKMDGFIFPAPFAGVVTLISILALGYVWLGCRCEALGRDLKTLEMEQEELGKRLLNEEYRWARMKSPRGIEEALAKHSIEMSWPTSKQLIRLSDPDVSDDREVEGMDMKVARLERVIMNE